MIPSKADLAVAHWTARKVSSFIEDMMEVFDLKAAHYGSLSLDERFGIAATLVMVICVEPFERSSNNPAEMRKEIARQFEKVIRNPQKYGEVME